MKLIENTTTEFKKEYVDEIKKTIVAFANTDGGDLYIGLNDDGSVEGVPDAAGTMLKVSNSIRDAIKPDITLFVNTEIIIIESREVVKVRVQKGTASPYYLAGKGIRPEGVYIRQGASSVPATETAIIRMIKETDGERYETVRSLNQDLTFVEATKAFKNRNVPFGENQYKTLKLMTTDGVFTNLALLLSDQCCHSIKLAVFEGTDKSVFKDRRELTGSVLKQMNEAYAFIDRYNGTRAEISGLYRTERRDYPPVAVREALLNMLVHRDYAFSAGSLISIFDDHIEFVSIGGLVKGISFDDMMLGISLARNENLANVFYRLSLIEAYGTGVPKIVQAYDKETIKPEIVTSDNAFKISLPNCNYVRSLPEQSEMPGELFKLLKNRESIARKDVEVTLSISQSAAGRYLRQLVKNGILEIVGSGRNTRYVLKK